MNKKPESFESLMCSFESGHDLRTIFDDFLSFAICTLAPRSPTKSSAERFMLEILLKKYQDPDLVTHFATLLTYLTREVRDREGNETGSDVLGEFYERHISSPSEAHCFAPWIICMIFAHINCAYIDIIATHFPFRIYDAGCKSGRMLLATAKTNGPGNKYYGVDSNASLAKIAAINLFLHGMFGSEIMCADTQDPEDFGVSYEISFSPFGIIKIVEKEKSKLYAMKKESFPQAHSFPTMSYQDSEGLKETTRLLLI